MAAQKINEAHEHIAKAEKWSVFKILFPFYLYLVQLQHDLFDQHHYSQMRS